MILSSTREGLARTWAVRRVVVGVWLLHLTLAAAAAFPLWRTLWTAIGPLPGADALRGAIAYGVFADLAELQPGLVGAAGLVGVVVLGLGLLLGAAVSAGVLEVLLGGDGRSLGHRFGRGAGRFFGRFLRLTLAVGLVFGVVGALGVVPPLLLARAHLREGVGLGWPALVGAVAMAALTAVLASLVLDAARIHMVRSDSGVWPALRVGMASVIRRPMPWLGVWCVNAAILGAVVGLYLLARGAVSPDSGALILAMVVVQQAFVLARTGLRVTLLATEASLLERQRPLPARSSDPPTIQSEPGSSSPVVA